ncbi:MAG: hypothetical protein JWN76_604 [Chitinophagaceae bacterium]|nr:hypothetical protein [Chitinophagaceae bacterium]
MKIRTGVVYFILVLLAVSCEGKINQKEGQGVNDEVLQDQKKFTTIQWQDSSINFGTIKEGEKPLIHFRFKNTGDHPLYVVSVNASCGCTVVNYTKGAIQPGSSGEITGEFDSKGKSGEVNKTITVVTNTKFNMQHRLMFTGTVN